MAPDLLPVAVTGADDIRRQNLSSVLRLLHREGTLSRSQLTRATGLNRSTIAGLVAELTRRGLADERSSAGDGRAGRPSHLVSLSERTVAIAVHPEVDAIEVAMVGLDGEVRRRARYRNATSPTPEEFVSVVSAMLQGMLSDDPSRIPLGVGIAVPGLVRESDGIVQWAPHLRWRDVLLGDEVRARTGLPTVVVNDASCGVVAEHQFGAGRGADVLVYLNGGASGIGGGIAVDGQLLGGTRGYAGEFGHIPIDTDGARCECGAVGCLETVVRRDRLRALGVDLDDDPRGALAAVLRDPGPAADEVRAQVRALGLAIRAVVNTVDPRRIVLGGHLADLLGAVGEGALREAAHPVVSGMLGAVEIVPAALGDAILLIGAAEAVFGPVLADPTLVGT